MQNVNKIGLGVFRLEGDTCYNSVKNALELGYKHIDTAQAYGNEAEVGKAVADSGIPREEIFITTKIHLENLGESKFLPSLQESLKLLQTDYVDLLLIHWPIVDNSVKMEEYLPLLKNSKEQGMAKRIGVSNFTIAHVTQAMDILGGSSEIFTNQVEVHPYFQNNKLVDFCQKHGILISAYLPLAKAKVITDDVLNKIAQKHNTNAVNVTLAWLLSRNIITFPSSTKRENLESNLKSLQLQLDAEDIKQISSLDSDDKLTSPDYAPDWD